MLFRWKMSLLIAFTFLSAVLFADIASRVNDKYASALASFQTTVVGGRGVANFNWKGNSGRFAIKGDGTMFDTAWSGCGPRSVYAYSDYVRLVAKLDCASIDSVDARLLANADWSWRAVVVGGGEMVAFLNGDMRVVIAKVLRLSSKGLGDDRDELSLELRIMGDSSAMRKTAELLTAKYSETDHEGASTGDEDYGVVRFNFKENRGKYIVRAAGRVFDTRWSGCNGESVYLYRDGVKLLGFHAAADDFPDDVSILTEFDWTRRSLVLSKDKFAVLMNSKGEFMGVRVLGVKDRSRGASTDEVEFEYFVYPDSAVSKKTANTVLRVAEKGKRAFVCAAVGKSGVVSFDWKANNGDFIVKGMGTSFTTKWSGCGKGTLYAYRDGVKYLGFKEGVGDFPNSANAFESYDWSRRDITVGAGDFFVLMNSDGRFLCVHVLEVHGGSDTAKGKVVFEFKIY